MLITDTELLALLKADCCCAGSHRACPARHGLAESYVADLLKGRRPLGPKVPAPLGYERVVRYREKHGGGVAGREETVASDGVGVRG